MSEERPFTIALSQEEVIALVKWHVAQARGATKRFGEASLKLHASSIFPRQRDLKALHDAALAKIESHSLRARGLASILK